MKSVQRELKRKLREGKDSYRQKLEDKLKRNKVKEVWRGMREITGLQQPGRVIGSDPGMVDELNQFLTGSMWNLLQHTIIHTPTGILWSWMQQLSAHTPTKIPHIRFPHIHPQTLASLALD